MFITAKKMLGVLPMLLAGTGDVPVHGEIVAMPYAPSTYLAQQVTFSNKCSTPNGICYVAAQPVGSPCQCGPVWGTIIP